MTLPDTIALNDTALLNAMIKAGITLDDLLASGEYKFDNGAAYFKEAEAFSREGFKEEFCKKVSLKRIGSAKEIGDAVCMLAGGAFAYMTGATVVIDGGLMLKQV